MSKKTSKNEAFNELVKEVAENDLQPAEDMTSLEAQVDEYIKESQLAFVMTARGQHNYYIWYKPTGEWLNISWNKLRRDCPVVFRNNDTAYAEHLRLVNDRVKKAGRVFKTARLRVVEFE